MTKDFDWTPGIGDPTIGGWITVILYFTAAYMAFRATKYAKDTISPFQEVWLWQCLTILLILLGINKQLDLQSALTELGRVMAHSQGWYGSRRLIQLTFILLLAIGAAVTALFLIYVAGSMSLPARLAILGSVFIVAFVVIRAASFHHVDSFLGTDFAGLKWNWILEMGGTAIIIIAGLWRRNLKVSAPSHPA